MRTHKRCPRCETIKPAAAFARNRAGFDGLQAYCRACFQERDKLLYPGLPRGSWQSNTDASSRWDIDALIATSEARNREIEGELRIAYGPSSVGGM